MLRRVTTAIFLSAMSLAASVQGQPAPDLFVLDRLAQNDPPAALLMLNALLEDTQNDQLGPRDLQDLHRMRADLLWRAGERLAAARQLEALAHLTQRHRDALLTDPAPIWREASQAFEIAGDLAAANRAAKALLREQSAVARPPEVLTRTLQRLRYLANETGDRSEVDRLTTQIAQLNGTAPRQPTRGTPRAHTEVDLFYATDRARSGRSDPAEFYSGARGSGLELGVVTVTIPEGHRPGVMEQPSIWRLEFSDNPARHMVLNKIDPMGPRDYFGRMARALDQAPRREVFVYVHGFNITFEQGARRASQLAYDIDFDGVPVLYSWPSRGTVMGYVADSAAVRLSARRLTRFLTDLRARTGAQTVHLIAHSMGAQALAEAMELIAFQQQERQPPIFDQVLFAAPDIDAGLFSAMLPVIRPLAKRVTLYASETDWALQASRRLHGDAARAGLGGQATMVHPAMDSVDMSVLGEDMLAHNYFADGSSALADIMTLFWRNLDPSRRCGMSQAPATDRIYWEYRGTDCADAHLMSVLAMLRRTDINDPAEARDALARTVFDPDLKAKLEPVVMELLSR
ncbi:MAG: alpha/beta hydrolase [Rhodobacteraceae bacterium]|nr:alpha/beta hydrolase [Paracoccaceae bacterium]